MSRRWWQLPLWALAFVSTLAPSQADGNIGCLFSSSLCIDNLEWCYDDAAFGKCIPIFEDEPEDGSFYQYDMSGDQLQWFESELQALVHRGYRWEHAYTQCVLQAMLYTLRNKLDVNQINTKLCDQFMDPKLVPEEGSETIDNKINIPPDDTAYIRYMPDQADFAVEVYNPPLLADGEVVQISPGAANVYIEDSNLPTDDKIRELVVLKDKTDLTGRILPFGGFRERLQAESRTKLPNLNIDKQKKSLYEDEENLNLPDEERLGAHYRKHKIKPIEPYTAEYITSNRFSPLDERLKTIAQEKYKESFAAKNFPFEYENPDNEIPEPRIYFDNVPLDSYGFNGGNGEKDSKETSPENNIKNMQQLTQLWDLVSLHLKHKEQGPLGYAEGGTLNADEVQGDSNISPEELQKLVYNALGFKRRERDDVKKPGPRLDALNRIKFLYSKNVTDKLLKGHALQNRNPADNSPSGFAYDPSYAYVRFKNKFGTTWEKGIGFISKVEKLLGLEDNTFTYPRVNITEVTFKVEKNTKGFTAADVAAQLGNTTIKEMLQQQTGAQIFEAGIGDISKSHPISRHISFTDTLLFGLEMPVFLALAGSCAVLLVGVIVFLRLLQKDLSSKRKSQGLASAADIDAEATRDYQDLCRARMYGGSGAASEPRVAALSKDSETKSPSARSSTSSWSEEPALTNMDISTGHMVLAYMEDHLRNKDRLDQEWRALCAYEAEPNATTAALKPENTGKNRYADVLPYDHSRVCLNTLTNHLGSDYINASTITDHDPRNPAYIAAAGPLAATAPDFWQMVWEQGSVVMVMLTRLTENGQQLCHRYWPEEGSQTYHIYEVHLVSEHIWCDDYLVRSFYLKNQRSGETRTVTQFHFLSWPEHQVPSSAKALLEFRRKVNKSYRGRSCPIVVHCSDGAGRTGTYCLIDMVLNRMAKGAKEIDIAATLEHIRDQRPRTVATKQQFEFVLMAVAEEVHAILKALPAHLQQLQEKKEKDKEATDKDK